MIEARRVAELRAYLAHMRERRQRLALVPTMGNLHAGHVRLFTEARRHADAVIASIYVNPLQFGANEDFGTYPRTPVEDREALLAANVDLLFMPEDADIYPRGPAAQTTVEVPGISDVLCGAYRPGHFRGVTTVVNRLFNVIAPEVALFGKKDYQQWLVIRMMVADLGLPIEIVGVDTVRETDGLALSSRNRYLNAAERAQAPMLYQTLQQAARRVRAGAAPASAETEAADALRQGGFRPEYVSVRRAADLGEPRADERELVVLAAAWLGRTRLIDNVEFTRAI
ncbi:MAG: pantoate--beta-alanine ligase [Gammaproteobacteria bacterium]